MKAPKPGPVPDEAPAVAPEGSQGTEEDIPSRPTTGKVESIVSVLLVATPFLLFALFVLLDRIFS
jgi:hypothetical protein